MSGEQKLSEFLGLIDVWIESKGLPKFEWNDEAEKILNMKHDDLKSLSSQECLEYAFELCSFSEYLLNEKHRDETILDWADSSLWYIISKEMNQYGDQYVKWQQKYYSAIRENPLAREILRIHQHAGARIKAIGTKCETIQKMAQLLNDLSRRK